MFITNSRFTNAAREAAREGTPITLIDGNDLVRLVIKYELYITPVTTYVLDDFYDEEELLQKRSQLLAELKKLPEQEYNVLVKIVLEDKKYKEVAEELHISVNTVKTHLSRALKMLRRFNMIEILILFNL